MRPTNRPTSQGIKKKRQKEKLGVFLVMLSLCWKTALIIWAEQKVLSYWLTSFHRHKHSSSSSCKKKFPHWALRDRKLLLPNQTVFK